MTTYIRYEIPYSLTFGIISLSALYASIKNTKTCGGAGFSPTTIMCATSFIRHDILTNFFFELVDTCLSVKAV